MLLHFSTYLSALMVRRSASQLLVVGSVPGLDAAWLLFWDRWPSLVSKLSWDVTTTQGNSALHSSSVAKSSTSFSWGKGGKVTTAGWQVTLWHVAYGMWFPIAVWWFPRTAMSDLLTLSELTLLNVFWVSLHQLFGTHCQRLLSNVSRSWFFHLHSRRSSVKFLTNTTFLPPAPLKL